MTVLFKVVTDILMSCHTAVYRCDTYHCPMV